MSAAVAPEVKGWCPGAHRPMMSGDGLIVRVRPPAARLTTKQSQQVAALAVELGNGIIDLTSRANLQIRGVQEANYPKLLDGLRAAGLLDPTPEEEARRNILTTPFWRAGDSTPVLYDTLVSGLSTLPDLPAKMGVALDTGHHPVLTKASADFRFERGRDGALILRADGALTGQAVSTESAHAALSELAKWFVMSGGRETGRMRKHLQAVSLPERFQGSIPAEPAAVPEAGPHHMGFLVGAAFGALEASDLLRILTDSGAVAMRVTPWRMLLLEGASEVNSDVFITQPDPKIRAVQACPGAPFCTQAQVETRPFALALSSRVPRGRTLHVSGCTKGCARAQPADVTLVGSDGKFDLVRGGAAWDEPETRGLSVDAIEKDLTF